MPDGGLAASFKMLTYNSICAVFSSGRALPANTIRGFEATSNVTIIFVDKKLHTRPIG
jgi:hypothetical protein